MAKINKEIVELTAEQIEAKNAEINALYLLRGKGEIDDAQLKKELRKVENKYNKPTTPDEIGDYVFNRLTFDLDPTVIFDYFQFLLTTAQRELGYTADPSEFEKLYGGLTTAQIYDELKFIKRKGIGLIPSAPRGGDKVTVSLNGLEYNIPEYVTQYLIDLGKGKQVETTASKLAQLKELVEKKQIDGKLYIVLKNKIEAGDLTVQIPEIKVEPVKTPEPIQTEIAVVETDDDEI